MGRPVIHFEVIGRNPDALRGYYGELFGWQFDTTSPVSDAVSEPENYGFVEPSNSGTGGGIPGGVGGGQGYPPRALFYVGVPDIETALQDAERLGGTRTIGPERSPTGLVIGHFTDPEGNLIGVAAPT